MADNVITVIGNVTRDPEIRYTPNGQANANFGVAVNRRWQNRQTNEWEERTSFFNVGRLAAGRAIERDGCWHDRHDVAAADRKADAAILEALHHAAGRSQAVCAAAAQHDRVNRLDHVVGTHQVRLACAG
jgi:hypothetical protein